MKAIFWIGLVVIVLGILSLVVAVPHTKHEGFKAGDVSVGVETRHNEKVAPGVSAALIVAGAVMMVGGGLTRRP